MAMAYAGVELEAQPYDSGMLVTRIRKHLKQQFISKVFASNDSSQKTITSQAYLWLYAEQKLKLGWNLHTAYIGF